MLFILYAMLQEKNDTSLCSFAVGKSQGVLNKEMQTLWQIQKLRRNISKNAVQIPKIVGDESISFEMSKKNLSGCFGRKQKIVLSQVPNL